MLNDKICRDFNIDLEIINDNLTMREKIIDWINLYTQNEIVTKRKHHRINLFKFVIEELSRLITLEMTFNYTSNNEELVESFEKNINKHIKKIIEHYLCFGGVMIRLYYDDNVKLDVIPPDNFYIIEYNSDEITSVLFTKRFSLEGQIYVKYELHYHKDNQTEITTKLYRLEDNELILLEQHNDKSILVNNIPTFHYVKTNLVNNICLNSPYGLSILNSSLDLLREVEEINELKIWELRSGRRKLAVLSDYLDNDESFNNDLFIKLDNIYDRKLSDCIEQFSPILRIEDIIKTENNIIQHIEDNIGLSRGSFSETSNISRTATELKILKYRTYNTVKDNQDIIEKAIKYIFEMTKTLLSLNYSGFIYSNNDDLTVSFADSVLSDEERQREIAALEVATGLRSKLDYLINIRELPENKAIEELERIKDEELNLIDSVSVE